MSNKLNAYIDLAKLQGAHRMKLKGKDGTPHDCIVINIGQSRAKPSERNPERVNLSLALVPNRDGKDDFGQTHWICEPTTKEEREGPNPPKLPILGNAREFDDGAPKAKAAPQPAAAAEREGGMMSEGMADDDIPF